MRPVTLTLRAADVELEPGIYTHYDFALLLPPAAHRDSKGRRRLRGVSRLDDISYVTGSGVVWGAANGSFRLSSSEHGVSHSGRSAPVSQRLQSDP